MTRPRRRGARLAALALVLVLAAPALAVDDLELKVKAAFLFNFAKFTTWPAAKAVAPDAPLYLCVQGSSAMGGVLEQTVRGRAIEGHAIEVLQAPGAEELRRCHVVYVGAGDDDRIAAELDALAGHGVLSVHEAGTAQPAGVVRFFLSDAGRVRFEINVTAASREQLVLSAKLLEVSQVVTR